MKLVGIILLALSTVLIPEVNGYEITRALAKYLSDIKIGRDKLLQATVEFLNVVNQTKNSAVADIDTAMNKAMDEIEKLQDEANDAGVEVSEILKCTQRREELEKLRIDTLESIRIVEDNAIDNSSKIVTYINSYLNDAEKFVFKTLENLHECGINVLCQLKLISNSLPVIREKAANGVDVLANLEEEIKLNSQTVIQSIQNIVTKYNSALDIILT